MKTNTKKFQLFEFSERIKLSQLNIEYLLECLGENFKSSANPVHAWTAIHFCIKAGNGKKLPDWVIAYLAQCSERMLSKQGASDLRKILPEVLAFPKKRRGPGKPLRPGREPDKESFTTKFVNYVMQGDDPKTARANACNDMSPKFADKYDDQALVKILVDTMGLPAKPQNPNQWKRTVCRWAAESFAELSLWDASATKEDRAMARALADKMYYL
jgi:hypothetical protein